MGYDADLEIQKYGHRIINVHIKDRLFMGETVRLGLGSVDFRKVFDSLNQLNYQGNFILQTARSNNNKHSEELKMNLTFLNRLIKR